MIPQQADVKYTHWKFQFPAELSRERMYPSSQIQRTRNAVALRRGFRRAASMYVGVGTAFAYIPPIPEMHDDEEDHEKGFKANITIGQVRRSSDENVASMTF